ncbi:hypothetical protein ACIBHX_30860 [Nonomuraea sp. NPDC050536]|uniref:hypothetical protein n=1 Tax=Nonomuraea sp. NPDC050536 TaxID=3364366 RepID=UPI0037C57998
MAPDDPPGPGGGRASRRMPYNPLPGRIEPPDDEPVRLVRPRRTERWWLAGAAVLVVSALIVLVWRNQESPPAVPSPIASTARLTLHTTTGTGAVFQPLTTRTAWPVKPSHAKSRTPSPKPTPTPTPTAAPKPSPRPTVTVTSRVTVTPKPTRTRHKEVYGGPSEPPVGRPTCLTWGDCHDDPPGARGS